MIRAIEARHTTAAQLGRRGYFIAYQGPGTLCPGCGRAHWYVGRVSVECAFCGVSLDLPGATARGIGLIKAERPRAA